MGVSSYTSDAEAMKSWEPPVYPKSAEERQQIWDIVRTSHDSKLKFMFGSIPEEALRRVIDAMFSKVVAKGENVIARGDAGDYFYVVKRGHFHIYGKRMVKDPAVQKGGSGGGAEAPSKESGLEKVFEAGPGYAFGELALLYHAPRAATVTAAVEAEVWCLGSEAFSRLVVAFQKSQFNEYCDFLKKCDIFQELDSEQIAALAEVVAEEDFEADEAIIEQGDRDNKMFILRKGAAAACIEGDEGEVEVMQYKQGDYFGEIALLLGEPRKASIYAVGPTTCMYVSLDTFNRLLGPLRAFLERNMNKYKKYKDAIKQANSKEDAAGTTLPSDEVQATAEGALEVFEGGAAWEPTMRRRPGRKTRGQTSAWSGKIGDLSLAAQEALYELSSGPLELECDKAGAEASDQGSKVSKEASSLADKVAEDLKNPLLVSPCDAFLIPQASIQVFGGLRSGEKFQVDKVVIARTEVESECDGLEVSYTWSGPSWLQGSTSVAVLCQKGQKSESDPTPNQDNYFILHIGAIGIYGVCDGHGPFGHLVSFRLVQTLPHFLVTSPHFGTDWEKALREAFLSAQRDLLRFCDEHQVNVEASGAAGSMLVFEGPSIYVAHIGDSGVMLGAWSRHDSRVIQGTKDHKPGDPEEKARLEEAGSEVRQVDEAGSSRIYIKGTNFPGLTMSRAFGDTACGGVLQEPEISKHYMQNSDEYYAILASDGIWEFVDYEKAAELTAKKLRLKGPMESVKFLTGASRKRWAHVCGDYCDDITAILVQWNGKGKDKNTRHE